MDMTYDILRDLILERRTASVVLSIFFDENIDICVRSNEALKSRGLT